MNDSVLIEIRDVLLRIEARLPERKPKRLSRKDEATLTTLLPVAYAAVGNRTWVVKELIAHSKLETGPTIALREALEPLGSPKTIGRLLGRGADVDINGHRLTANGKCRDGVLYTIVTVSRESR